MQYLIAIGAFLAGLAFDLVWTLCVQSVQAQRPVRAANFALILYGCTLVTTILIIEHCIPAVIAYGMGNWVGTYIAVRRK